MDFTINEGRRNLPVPLLVEAAVLNEEGKLSTTGSLSVRTGKFTGRSPDDKFIVKDEITANTVDWGKINHPISEEHFEKIQNRMNQYISEQKLAERLYTFDGYVGADRSLQLPIRVITDKAWHCLFATQIFINASRNELLDFRPDFTLLSLNDFASIPDLEGTNSDTFIIINFKKKLILMGSTSYAGEIKKSMFSVMNFILPKKGIFPMHCSTNLGNDGRSALFFGLSGTGKTTLSADENRRLVGDDEHGWSNSGVFNFEGGCYAKCINLNKEKEPQIWNAIRFGSVMENVVIDPISREPDFTDGNLTENTRVVYPLGFIPGAIIPSVCGHPSVIVFLTADAFGVLPPISKLSKEGAMYHFMSGYTSKLAGTERGITEPKETFSQCFGAPFMPLKAADYAKLLGEKITEHGSKVYLINTGWSGGPYGIGRRIDLNYTRLMVSAAIKGQLENSSYDTHDIFNLQYPTSCDGVPSILLNPRNTWHDKNQYDFSAKRLARLFINNFKKFEPISQEIIKAGPHLN
ncbi:MAG TPA: phosphoenolpyruvate carboxykinase (ATP) [Candidatus Saccharimonadales bacterium]|nr:phosphoenolpyruvate carboxykinase (ATP) [Candidatus Saccharimonadales bacterium]